MERVEASWSESDRRGTRQFITLGEMTPFDSGAATASSGNSSSMNLINPCHSPMGIVSHHIASHNVGPATQSRVFRYCGLKCRQIPGRLGDGASLAHCAPGRPLSGCKPLTCIHPICKPALAWILTSNLCLLRHGPLSSCLVRLVLLPICDPDDP
jgi:hypothetical protein